MPIIWNSNLHRIKARQSVKEVLPWISIQVMHGVLGVCELHLITGYGGMFVDELNSWLKIITAFVYILDVTISVLTFTVWNKRDQMAACFNAVTQLPKCM
ncbi:unnamed protein product [Orchesella dallaii]|uniref:Gustatory receptor n=1 Tax=Orchesella dallaii TaxID=48710 RepID=A0ABP1S6Y6_9HEXA